MLFNKFFDIINDFSDLDSENFMNSNISCEDDTDLGVCVVYKLDEMKLEDEEYLEEFEEIMDVNDITSYKIEDGFLTFSVN